MIVYYRSVLYKIFHEGALSTTLFCFTENINFAIIRKNDFFQDSLLKKQITSQQTAQQKLESCVVYWCNALQPKEKVLPQVVEKILLQRRRCSILGQSFQEAERWDDQLWTFSSKSFLAHGSDLKEDRPEDHPIWITRGLTNENNSHYGILTGYIPQEALNIYLFSHWIWILMSEETDVFQHATTWIQNKAVQASWVWRYHNAQWKKGVWI
ncbi:DNA polymerase III subunit chi [Holospora curviuscula]|nr:DNA polymerase III subunit chi [Holospora curviuscula]